VHREIINAENPMNLVFVPHWVAVTGIDDKFMYSTIPLRRNPKREKSCYLIFRSSSDSMAI